MINNGRSNVSQYPGWLPDKVAGGGDRRISDSQIYDTAELLKLAEAENVQLWSNGARLDAAKWSLDISDISKLIVAAMKRGRFLGVEWCESKPGGPWAACEAWVITQREWVAAAGKDMDFTYYLKFAISRTGSILLMASNHPENT
jgi:hypothetical protein